MTRSVVGDGAGLTIGDLARRARVLPRYAARGLALLEKAGLIRSTGSGQARHQDGIIVGPGSLITGPGASSPGGGPGTHDTLLLWGITKQTPTAHAQQAILFHA